MKGEGRLDIQISRRDIPPRIAITSSRPLGLTRTLVGMTCEEAASVVPLLFSVCGMAQGAAAAEALGAACGREAAASTDTVRRLLVLAEAAREHLIAAVRDFASIAGMAADGAALLRVMQDFQQLRAALDPNRNALQSGSTVAIDAGAIASGIAALQATIETLVLRETCTHFLARTDEDGLSEWTQARQTPAQRAAALFLRSGHRDAPAKNVAFLPCACALPLLPRLLGPGARAFVASPTWQGSPCETGALGRQASHPLVGALMCEHANGILARIAARLVELASLPQVMRGVVAGAPGPSPWSYQAVRAGADAGTAEIDTARGRLIHAACVRQEKIAGYAILAPTEWNFHPEGVAAQGLRDLAASAGEEFELRARAFVLQIDPCVAFDLRAA